VNILFAIVFHKCWNLTVFLKHLLSVFPQDERKVPVHLLEVGYSECTSEYVTEVRYPA